MSFQDPLSEKSFCATGLFKMVYVKNIPDSLESQLVYFIKTKPHADLVVKMRKNCEIYTKIE